MANISFFRHIIYLSVKIYGFGERGNDNAHLFFPFRYPKSQNLYVALWRKGVTASCLCLLVKGNQVRILSCTRSCMSIKAFGFFMPLNVGVFGKVSENRRISQKTCLCKLWFPASRVRRGFLKGFCHGLFHIGRLHFPPVAGSDGFAAWKKDMRNRSAPAHGCPHTKGRSDSPRARHTSSICYQSNPAGARTNAQRRTGHRNHFQEKRHPGQDSFGCRFFARKNRDYAKKGHCMADFRPRSLPSPDKISCSVTGERPPHELRNFR